MHTVEASGRFNMFELYQPLVIAVIAELLEFRSHGEHIVIVFEFCSFVTCESLVHM